MSLQKIIVLGGLQYTARPGDGWTADRDPARWRQLLYSAKEQYPDHDGIQNEIGAILRRWSM